MKVLIIGADGQVGFELCKQFPKEEFDLVTTVLDPPAGSGHKALNLTDFKSIKNLIKDLKPDYIVNAAAYTAVDKAESERDLARCINEEAVKVIGLAAKSIDSIVIHYSTDYVYDGLGSHSRKEDESTNPVNYYGESKLKGELALEDSGCQHLIFRTSWVYGSHGHNFVKTMLKLGATRKELTIVSDQIGSPTSAFQIAECTKQAILKIASEGPDKYLGTYHLTGSGFTNWAEFAEEIFKTGSGYDNNVKGVLVKPIPSSDYPTPAKRPFNSRLDCSKLESTFGVKLDTWQNQLHTVIEDLYK